MIVVLNALMGLPPVVVGLAVFLSLSRSGPLGSWGLLFTPQAMVIAQTILVAPIIAALARQTIEDLWVEYQDELAAMNVGPARRVATLVWDARFSLVMALLAGFGRAVARRGRPDPGLARSRHLGRTAAVTAGRGLTSSRAIAPRRRPRAFRRAAPR
jgi:tungstate transport system permease protein